MGVAFPAMGISILIVLIHLYLVSNKKDIGKQRNPDQTPHNAEDQTPHNAASDIDLHCLH